MTLDDRRRTLAEVFSAAGYRTGGFAANLLFVSREHGLDRGFQAFRDYPRSPGAILRASALWQMALTNGRLRRMTGFHDMLARKSARDVNDEFLAWADRKDGRPWFAFLNYFDAHEPYLPRAPFAGSYSQGLQPRNLNALRYWPLEVTHDWRALKPEHIEAERAAYEETITGLDADLGALLRGLRSRGILDSTLVVITSDHGELFGENGAFSHGSHLYWRSLHVPLVIAWAGKLPAGELVSAPVSQRDLPSTILRLALPDGERLPGVPLLGLGEPPTHSPLVLSELANGFDWETPRAALQSVTGDDWMFIGSAKGPGHAYDLGIDTTARLVTDSVRLVAIIDSARARLAAAGVPELKRRGADAVAHTPRKP